MKNLLNVITRLGSRALLKTKKHSPEILLGVGIVTFVATVVTASKATLKLNENLYDDECDLQMIKKVHEDENQPTSDEDYRHDLMVVYSRIGLKLAKLYAPSAALGALSLTCFISSHVILDKRNAALTGSLVAIQGAFNNYRQKVIADQGKDADEKYYHGITKETIETTEEDPDGGSKVKVETVNKINGETVSPYARFFDEASSYWQKTPEYNYMFLKRQQSYANELLNIRGHVFLNEVYDMLDIPRSQLGAVTGWVLNGDGDGYIDFGMADITREKVRDFVNGYERSVLLDFNVDGVIYNLI